MSRSPSTPTASRPIPSGEGGDGATTASTKDRLLRAGERLFAEQGIHRVRLRELNALAGQRNPSALHYHFGSRDGLVIAILAEHQTAMDRELRPRLDELTGRPDRPSVREIVDTAVESLARQLQTESGRDFLRILPQVTEMVTGPLRSGSQPPSAQFARVLTVLEERVPDPSPTVRRERLVAYALTFISLFAERATILESRVRPALDDGQFTAHASDVLTALINASSTVA